MKSGPALRQLMSHRAIHDAAHTQIKQLTDMVQQLFDENKRDECFEVANVLVQHWEEKIIAHADAEDEGLYKELLASGEVEQKELYMLMRDHDLFRQIIRDMKQQLSEKNHITTKQIYTFHALIVLNEYHHIGEEATLFPGQ